MKRSSGQTYTHAGVTFIWLFTRRILWNENKQKYVYTKISHTRCL